MKALRRFCVYLIPFDKGLWKLNIVKLFIFKTEFLLKSLHIYLGVVEVVAVVAALIVLMVKVLRNDEGPKVSRKKKEKNERGKRYWEKFW